MAQTRLTPLRQSTRYVLKGLAITVLLLLIKAPFEQTQGYAWLEQRIYSGLSSVLPAFREKGQSVIVIDISHLPSGTYDGNGKLEVTSRAELRKLLQVLAEIRPQAVAIDIDFSPNQAGWQNDQDPSFFDFCLSLSPRLPLVLGVYRTQREPPETWLGAAQYAHLAASMLLDEDNLQRVPVWLHAPGVAQPLPGLAVALAQARYGPRSSPMDKLAPWVYKFSERRIDSTNPQGLQVEEVLVNYSAIGQLISETIRISNAQELRRHAAQIENRLVLLGAVDQATDTFAVPVLKRPQPGVFVHASAVFTLASEPVYALSHGAAIGLDLLISLAVLLAVVKARRGRVDAAPRAREAAEARTLQCAVVLVLCAGVAVVYYARVFWFDFLLVVLFLLLHPGVEKRLHAWLASRHGDTP